MAQNPRPAANGNAKKTDGAKPNGNGHVASAPKPDGDDLPALVGAMIESYRSDPRGHHINRRFLPSRVEIIEVAELLLQLFYPGYFGRQDLTDENVGYHVGNVLSTLREKLSRQIEMSLCYRSECESQAAAPCAQFARGLSTQFLGRLPEIRAMLLADVQAAFDGDPAAVNLDEVILAYPGLLAVTIYRVAHELHRLGIPLMPRIMTEWAHAQTGADIHPGAHIGPSFFVDHATGVVIGETTDIGAHVKLYQGVTLGALSVPRDGEGRAIRGAKRHPTVEDGVTVYANATVLGGATVLGEDSVVGGSVFITKPIPPGSRVAVKPPELRVKMTTEPPRPRDDEEGHIDDADDGSAERSVDHDAPVSTL